MAEAKAKKQTPEDVEEKLNGDIQESSEVRDQESDSQEVAETTDATEAKTAKAGKRSAKSLKEAEEKAAKEERKQHAAEEDEAPKAGPAPKTRTRLERRGKNYRKAAEAIETDKEYSLADALALAVKTSPVKFDASIELHINLNVDPRHADQNVRDNLVLPQGTGKKVRVAVLADADDAAAGKKAGADIAGADELFAALDKQQIDFDILVATPAMMPKLGKYARLLGPKGLMPNPKSGTVTTNITKAVEEAKAGRVEYRVDSAGIVHVAVGKVSFGEAKLTDNAKALFASIKAVKPASIKSTYVKAIHITTTMGPSIKVQSSEV